MISLPRRRAAGYALIVLLVAAVYGRSLDDPFHFDDLHAVVDNPNLRDLARVPRFFVDPGTFSADSTLAMYRPLLLTSLALNHAVSGQAAWSHHATNVAVHAGVVLLLFELLRRWLGARRQGAALLGALLFGLHPVHSEAVYYVSSRSESLAALFVLLALVVRGVGGSAHWGPRAGAATAFAAGLLTKSTAVVFVPLAVLFDRLAGERSWRRVAEYATYAVLAAGYVIGTRDLLARATWTAPVRPWTEQLWSQVKAFVYYLQLLAVPRGLSVDHQFQLSAGPDRYAAPALLLLASVLGVAWFGGGRGRPAWWLSLWFAVALAPASVVPLNVIANEHRLYLAGVAIAAGCAWLAADRAAAGAAVAARGLWLAVPVLGLLACLRGTAWDSEASLWEDAMRKGPDMARPRFVLGGIRARQGRPSEAADLVASGLARDPGFAPGYRQLAEAQLDLGQVAAATATAAAGVSRRPQVADLWALQAEVARARALTAGDSSAAWFDRSARAYARALALAPDEPAYHDNLGNTLQELGRPAQALPHHLRAVELAPRSAASWLNLGNAHWLTGDRQAAEAAYLTAVGLDSTYAEAWLNLAALYDQAGASDRAAMARRRAQASGGRR